MEIRDKVNDLVKQVLNGQAMEAFEQYYAENVTMQENSEPKTVGKDANRKREEEFFGSIEEFHSGSAEAVLVDGNQAAIHWTMEVTVTGDKRVVYNQVALQTWENGQIVDEKFFYNKG